MRIRNTPLSALCFALVCMFFLLTSCVAKDGADQSTSGETPAPRMASVGHPAPPFSLRDLSGKDVSLEEFRGSVVMLEFFTSWCLPCQIVADDVEALYNRFKAKGFVVIGISLKDGFNRDNLRDYVERYKISYPVLIDDDKVSKQYGVITMPTSVIIDREGVVRARHLGIVRDQAAVLTKEIEPLIR